MLIPNCFLLWLCIRLAINFHYLTLQDKEGESEKGAGAEAETESEIVAKEDNKGIVNMRPGRCCSRLRPNSNEKCRPALTCVFV